MEDATTREPFDTASKVGEIVQNFARDQGLYLRTIGDLISFMPPSIINEEEIGIVANRFLGALDDAWEVVRDRI